ncbi:putative Transmembrane protein [Quillaja saponaria]|uniref:Transmembrane protein n=1 Tax=Quillaja saponaria TaxID=32244 RepID=A0AAD7LQH5_QUISA|nr:putative Transmembrane protein [Quillaja saponaria]
MLLGHTDGLSELRSSKDHLLADPVSELDEDEYCSEQIVYAASFEELASNCIQYDIVIWLSISLLLVLAWGVGIIMLLYLPYRRYVLRKDLSSRKLYVTSTEIVYKVSRPSYIPFWGKTATEKHLPLSLVIDIIIEQGCLQSVYGMHTFRIESIAHGKAAPVDELQVQGVSNPSLFRKVIMTEASKVAQDHIKSWKPAALTSDGENMLRTGSLTEGPSVLRSPSKSWKMTGSPRNSAARRLPGDLLLNKLEEVSKSVKKIELLIEKSRTPESS